MSGWLHHVHVWLDADTWHWAMLEIGGVILLIVFIIAIAAACRGGGGSRRAPSRREIARRETGYAQQASRDIDQAMARTLAEGRALAEQYRRQQRRLSRKTGEPGRASLTRPGSSLHVRGLSLPRKAAVCAGFGGHGSGSRDRPPVAHVGGSCPPGPRGPRRLPSVA
jgi:hypothetical protein